MLQPYPTGAALIDQARKTVTFVWSRWFTAVRAAMNKRAEVVGSIALTAQTASIASTTLPTSLLVHARYRVSFQVRVTTAAATSSAIQVTIGWTDGGVAQTHVGTNLTGNLTTTRESAVIVIRCDSASAITYTTTYASNPAAAMAYQLDAIVEHLP